MKNNSENPIAGGAENLYSFAPIRLLREMGIDETKGGSLLGEKKDSLMAYMCGGVELKNGLSAVERDGIFDSINRMLSYALPAIVKNQGAIEDFKEKTFRALFNVHAEDALTAAISICESFSREAETDRSLSIALTYGMVSLGVVGYSYRMSVISLSPVTSLGAMLQEKAASYSARILVTGALAEQIPDFATRFNHRLLGRIFLRESGSEETLYDVFDGDEIAVRNVKRKTKTLFERGVALYLERRFQEARGCFIEVLKVDRSDKAARNYLFLCDTNYNLSPEDRAAVKVWLEEF